jgi:hypothetical protein
MGLFVDRVPSDPELESVVDESLRADPADAADPAKRARHVSATKAAAKSRVTTYHWPAIIVGIAIAGILLGTGIVLTLAGDSWSADQALKEATTQGYKAPTSSLPALATSIVALGSAWSGGLVSAVLGGGDS